MQSIEPKRPLLILDTSCPLLWIGCIDEQGKLHSQEAEADPTKSLFPAIERLLERCGLLLRQLESIAFCEGPGSAMGVRTLVMALRAWQAVGIPASRSLFAFNSLAAASLVTPDGIDWLVTDARRKSWHLLDRRSAEQTVHIFSNEELERSEKRISKVQPFPQWTKTDAPLESVEYDRSLIFGSADWPSVLRRVESAEPLVLRNAEFQRWTPQIHRASDK